MRAGINSVLTLTVDPLPSGFAAGLDVVVGHVPMRDHQPPPVDAISKGVGFVEEQVKAGRTVLVHCLAGEGRTGCVLAAYLVRTRGIGADEALAEIRKAKRQFVEWRQEVAVRDFAARELAR